MPVLKEIPADRTGHVPVKIWTSEVESSAEDQLAALAGSPVIFHHVAAMPDVHYGLGATIGSVFATRDALLPTAVGVDIGCGVLAQSLGIRAVDLSEPFLRELHERTKQEIPTGFGQHPGPQPWEGFEDETRYTGPVTEIVRQKGPPQLGSLGGGNHFLELCKDADGLVWLMLHSGSRGAGNLIATHHVNIARALNERLGIPSARDLWVLPLDTQEGQDYLRDMLWAQDYAMENRQRMLHIFLDLFADLLHKRLRADLDADPALAVNIHHNYAGRETHFGEEVWVHRKGATYAGEGVLGIIPGSMATGSYIVRGLGNPESFRSCSHGAGRVMSRGEATRSISLESFAHKMRGIVAETGAEYVDEAPQAYKDLDTVIHNQADLIEPVRRLTPIMNVKGAGRPRKKDRTRDRDNPVQSRKQDQRQAARDKGRR